jgi:hypothetical protein
LFAASSPKADSFVCRILAVLGSGLLLTGALAVAPLSSLGGPLIAEHSDLSELAGKKNLLLAFPID